MTAPNLSMKKIPWWSPELWGAETPLVLEVLKSNYINEGQVTDAFERKVADIIGAKHGIACASGTAALFLSVAALGIGHGDEVLVPDATFIASANAVSLAGAKPVLVDIDRKTLTIDVADAERRITAKTKAIMPVHVSGRAADMQAIDKLAARHDLYVIEDAAEALCSKYQGKFLGTLGTTGCFSFSPNKTVTTGQGGIVVTNDDEIAGRIRELKDQGRPKRGTGGDDLHPSLGYNFKLTNLQAAIGLGQLSYLQQRVETQRNIYRWYKKGLEGVKQLQLLPFDVEAGETPQWTDCLAQDRDQLADFLNNRQMGNRKFWHPLHTQKPYFVAPGDYLAAVETCAQALWLPSSYTLTEQDIVTVCAAIREFYHGR